MRRKIKKLFTLYAQSITHNAKGFTLIELAMVLVVIGLLLGLGAGLLGPLTKRGKLIESREAVKAAKEAVQGYAVKNGYLPANLEAAGAKRLDAWGRDISFYRASEISSGNACGVNSTAIQVYECTSNDCSTYNIKSNIAFIVYSMGDDGNGSNTGTSSPFYIRIQGSPYTDAGRDYQYDDIAAYVSLDEIRSLRGCPQSLVITSPTILISGEEDSFYSYSLQATGGMPPYNWTGTGGSGLTLNTAGLMSGTINVNAGSSTGELTTCTANIPVNVTVTDSASSPSVSYLGTIPVRPKPLTIITQSLPSAHEGSPYSATIAASGGRTPYSWNMSVSPSCPTGLTCSGNAITGTPATGTAGTYTIASTVNDTCMTNTRNFAMTINSSGGGGGCPAMALAPPSGTSWSATVGTLFNQSVTVSGGQSPYTNTQCTPVNCGGLTLNCSASGATISGTPSSAGTCSFNVAWRDSCSPTPQTTSGAYLVNITGLPPTCTLSASPGVVLWGQTAALSWNITNGPANAVFSPLSGACTSFSGSTGGSCTTGSLSTAGANTFNLMISNAYGNNSCSTTLYVGCQNYLVWNQTGATRDFTIDAICRNNLGNGAEITQPANNRYLNVGESIIRHSSTIDICTSSTAQTLTYDQAMNVDIIANGGNGNCLVNFTLTGAQDR